MTILQINKFFYPKGGADKHYLELIEILLQAGFDVAPFSMKFGVNDKFNFKSEKLKNIYNQYEKYFVSAVNFGQNKSFKDYLKLARLFWSFEAAKKIESLIFDLRFKKKNLKIIAHLHNIYHQISPSILPVLKKHQIPIVMTVHDLHLISPLYAENLFEKFICFSELFFHNKILNINKYIDLFIAPSEFVKKELLKCGIKESKIKVLPHFIKLETRDLKPEIKNDYILYFGRLAQEKGIDVLIEAHLKSGVDLPLYIAGEGPDAEKLKINNNKSKIKVKFLGNLEKKELESVIAGSLFTIIPSRAPETFGMAVLESYQFKKPVIASNIGALPELVKDNETGLLFKPGNIEDLAAKIKLLISDADLQKRLSENGFYMLTKSYSPNNYRQKIIDIYKNLL